MNDRSRPSGGGSHLTPATKSGSTLPPPADTGLAELPDHLRERITVHPVTGEWIWTGPLDRDGYGRCGRRGAHRVVYEAVEGPIAVGLVLDHVKARGCTTNACVSPWHLEPVTVRTNTLRGKSFAARNFRKVECDSGHPYDLLGTYWRPNGHRDCRRCGRIRARRYKERMRQRADAGGGLARAA